MKKNTKTRLFYIHTPKTGGTSVNQYFMKVYPETALVHVEADLKKETNLDLSKYDFISGHLTFPAVSSLLDPSWRKMVTFREPYSFVVSHMCWIRRLADEDQRENFQKHPENIQKIAVKMKEFDFSIAGDIRSFISWLEEFGFSYLHNTQTIFMSPKKNIKRALLNLDSVEFVGTLERLDDFLAYVSYKLSLELTFHGAPIANVNRRNYGFNIDDTETRKELYPLIKKDIVLYDAALKRLDKDILSCKGFSVELPLGKKTFLHNLRLMEKIKNFKFY
ncbi:sulfotransferase family 2 domain-containing protein [Leucothrix arctica]|uniref:Sulfotransferase family protein n=1 Tax=Leucothrix arctica TaxID=1481894 RepID=A0A317CJF5_9GAMM|nr:sulfotransferase family 2 domain-containing protein [Leucothrix arctica]PWQ98694.1 hypothetical protein DKT75_02470 [Leucothrix arctica]